jgi:hypothetical protein
MFLLQVAIPIGGDQLANGNEVERLGIGASNPFFSLTEEKLAMMISQVLADPAYGIRFLFNLGNSKLSFFLELYSLC